MLHQQLRGDESTDPGMLINIQDNRLEIAFVIPTHGEPLILAEQR